MLLLPVSKIATGFDTTPIRLAEVWTKHCDTLSRVKECEASGNMVGLDLCIYFTRCESYAMLINDKQKYGQWKRWKVKEWQWPTPQSQTAPADGKAHCIFPSWKKFCKCFQSNLVETKYQVMPFQKPIGWISSDDVWLKRVGVKIKDQEKSPLVQGKLSFSVGGTNRVVDLRLHSSTSAGAAHGCLGYSENRFQTITRCMSGFISSYLPTTQKRVLHYPSPLPFCQLKARES